MRYAHSKHIVNAIALLMRLLPASFLLGAAALKGHLFLTNPLERDPLLGSRLVLAMTILLEGTLGSSLILNAFPRIVPFLSSIAYLCFSVASLTASLSGRDSCSCFGALSISPVLVTILDICSALMLVAVWKKSRLTHYNSSEHSAAQPICRFNFRHHLIHKGRLYLLVTITLINASLLIPRIHWNLPAGVYITENRSIYLDPEQWLGMKLPIANQLDISSQLMSGRWTVIIISSDCSDCYRLINALKLDYLAGREVKVSASIAIVDIKNAYRLDWSTHREIVIARLDRHVYSEWNSKVPSVLELQDGRVIAVNSDVTG